MLIPDNIILYIQIIFCILSLQTVNTRNCFKDTVRNTSLAVKLSLFHEVTALHY